MIERLELPTPSAHVVLAGRVLIDTSHGSVAALAQIERFLDGRPVDLIALTHGHSDHAGGAAALRERLGVPVALHRDDHATVARDAALLLQPIPEFPVDVALGDGDELPGGLRVVSTRSQTPGHVVFWSAAERTAITGDLLQADDAAWMPFTETALDDAIEAIRRIAELDPVRAISGHGAEVNDVAARCEQTIATYEAWRADPARRAGHHARRIGAAWIARRKPRPFSDDAVAGLAEIPMFGVIAAVVGVTPHALARRTVEQLIGSGAVEHRAGRLVPTFPTIDVD